MALSRLALVRELDQPADEVHLTYVTGSQTLLVSIRRDILSDLLPHPVLPSDENYVVQINLHTLEPVVQGKLDRGETTMRTNPGTGNTTALIELTRADLVLGLRQLEVPRTDGPAAGAPSVPPAGGAAFAGEGRLGSQPVPQRGAATFAAEGGLVAGAAVAGVGNAAGRGVAEAVGEAVWTQPTPGSVGDPMRAQTYIVLTPLNFPGATLISLTLRFGDGFHNLMPAHVTATLAEEFEGWVREPLKSGIELINRLATIGSDLNPSLRVAIIEALDERAAALQFSDPSPFRLVDLEKLATGLVAFSKLPRRDLIVGVMRVAGCLILLSVVVGVGTGLLTTTQYAVTEIGNAMVDRVALKLRADDRPSP